jgi:hypothetical protein
MNRRLFLKWLGAVSAGVLAADQLELVEKLTHERRSFLSAPVYPTLWGDGVHDDGPALQASLDGLPFYDVTKRKRIRIM